MVDRAGFGLTKIGGGTGEETPLVHPPLLLFIQLDLDI